MLAPVADEAAELAPEEMPEEAELALLLALLRPEAAELVMLPRMELVAAAKESSDDCAPDAPVAAAEERLARLLAKLSWAEVKLAPTEDWAASRDD